MTRSFSPASISGGKTWPVPTQKLAPTTKTPSSSATS